MAWKRTYCDFGEPPRASVIGEHPKSHNIAGRFRALAAIYNGLHGWRVWTMNEKRKIIFDTNKGHWVHHEVRKVQKSKDPVLLVGQLSSRQGIMALEKRLKGENHDRP